MFSPVCIGLTWGQSCRDGDFKVHSVEINTSYTFMSGWKDFCLIFPIKLVLE